MYSGDTVGRINKVPIREVWRREAPHFNSWLAKNIDVLGEALGCELSDATDEQAVGDLSVDIRVEDGEGRLFAVECQFGRSDHKHLGQLLTYFSNLEADVAAWLVEDPRPEHITAVGWLNEVAPGLFYLIKIEAVQIENSPPALLPTVIVEPSEEAREIGAEKKGRVEKQNKRREFWTGLLNKERKRVGLHSGSSPRPGPWINASTGVTGVEWLYWLNKHDARVELYIDRTSAEETSETNEAIFDFLLESRDEIEEEFGAGLEWDRSAHARKCSIKHPIELGGWADQEDWPQLQDKMIDAMESFHRALEPHLEQISETL